MTYFNAFYFDTNVVLDIIWKRNDDSTKLIGLIQKNGWKCGISYFAIMEALGVQQESRYIGNKLKEKGRIDKICRDKNKRDLSKEDLKDEYKILYTLFLSYYKNNIEYPYLTDFGWKTAIDIMRNNNISAFDALHIATAKEVNYEYFITSDVELLKIAKAFIKSYKPGEMVKLIEKEG